MMQSGWAVKEKSRTMLMGCLLMGAAFICVNYINSAHAAKFVSKSRKSDNDVEQTESADTSSFTVTTDSSISEQEPPLDEDAGSLDPAMDTEEMRLEDIPAPKPAKVFRTSPVESGETTAETIETTPENKIDFDSLLEAESETNESATSEPVITDEEPATSAPSSLEPFAAEPVIPESFGEAGGGMTPMTSALTLAEAERIALDADPLVKKSGSQQQAFKEQAVAAYSWPDPKLRMGVVNMPVETFNFEQEPMTQAVIGIMQMFPPAGSVSAKRDQFNELAAAAGHNVEDQKLITALGVRKSWLNVYYFHHAKKLLGESLSAFDQMISIARSHYRTGRGKQQDVIRAQLEQSMLQDRETGFDEQWEIALASLRKWIGGDSPHRELDMSLPALPELPNPREIEAGLEVHPTIQVSKSRVNASENEVEFSNAQFNPGWALDVRYGFRGADRDDFVSAMVTVDLPLFTGKRQNKQLLASEARLSASKSSLDDLRRVYQQKLEDGLATYSRINERLELYRSQLLPQAQQNTEATMNAYQSGVTSFNDLVRAQLAELSSQLMYLKLQVDQAKAQADLLYLAGG